MKKEDYTMDEIHFTVMAVEASAKRMNVSAAEMYQRLSRVNLIQKLVLGCYDVMHTQSLEHVAEDLVAALTNWEKKFKVR